GRRMWLWSCMTGYAHTWAQTMENDKLVEGSSGAVLSRAVRGALVEGGLAQQSEEAQLVLALHLRESSCRVHVADGEIAFVPQRVIRELVMHEILMHVASDPVDDRMHLEAAGRARDDRQIGAA